MPLGKPLLEALDRMGYGGLVLDTAGQVLIIISTGPRLLHEDGGKDRRHNDPDWIRCALKSLLRSEGASRFRMDEDAWLDLDTGFGKVVVGQQLTPTDAVVSITRDGSGRRDQAGLASRMLGGRAMRAALNSGPMRPVAGVRRVMCRPSLVIATSWSRSRSRSTSPHSGRKPAIQQRSSSSLRRTSARKEQNTWPRMAASEEW